MSTILVFYLIGASLVAMAVFGYDKLMAKWEKQRIPEKLLILFALAGGSVGALFGMVLFNHKTSKALFRYGVPIIIAFQVVAYWWWKIR